MNTLAQFFPLLMGAPAGDGSGGGSGQLFTTFITFGLVIVIFYFLIIRPQSKKQKETKRMLSEIKKGDRVATIGGMHGTVVTVRDDVVILKVDANTKLEFAKSAISQVLTQEETKKTQKKKEEEASPVEGADAEDDGDATDEAEESE